MILPNVSTDSRDPELFTARNVALLLAALLALAFYPVLFGGQSFFYRDYGVLAIPTAFYHQAAFWRGEIPLWNPYSNCGAPFLAQWGPMVCYPLNLIYLLLPLPWSLNFFCLLHLWIGGMGTYYLMRRWIPLGGGWPAAFAAIAFVFNGIVQGSITWPNYTAALGLWPWVLLTLERALDPAIPPVFKLKRWDGPGVAVVMAALLAAFQILTGVPEIILFTWLLATALAIHRVVTTPGRNGKILRYCAVVLLAAGVVSIQILPFFELLRHSQRTPGFAGDKWALPPWGWANFILPRFHTFKTAEGTAFQYGQEFLGTTYIGAPLLLLAVLGCFIRDRRAQLLGVASILAALLALGNAGWVYPALTRIFPFLGIARYPVKFVFLLSFTIPLLSAYGLQSISLREERPAIQRIVGIGLILSLIAGALVWLNSSYPHRFDRVAEIQSNSWVRMGFLIGFCAILCFWRVAPSIRGRAITSLAMLLLVFADGVSHLPRLNPTIDASVFAPGLWSQQQKLPKPELGNGRVFISPQAEDRLLRSMVADPLQNMLGKRLALWSHLNLLDLVPKVNGSSTLQTREEAVVQKWLYATTNDISPWLDFLNTTLQTSSNSIIDWAARDTVMPFLTGGQRILHPPTPAITIGTIEQALNRGTLNPAREVMIEGSLPGNAPTVVAFSDIQIRPEEITFNANAEKPTVAIIPQSWYPAWKYAVTSDSGSEAETVLKANYAFQAVPLPAGISHVRIYYHDTFFRIGAAVSVATLLLCVALLFASWRMPKEGLSHG